MCNAFPSGINAFPFGCISGFNVICILSDACSVCVKCIAFCMNVVSSHFSLWDCAQLVCAKCFPMGSMHFLLEVTRGSISVVSFQMHVVFVWNPSPFVWMIYPAISNFGLYSLHETCIACVCKAFSSGINVFPFGCISGFNASCILSDACRVCMKYISFCMNANTSHF